MSQLSVYIIQKYTKKSLSQLKKMATTKFNAFIRNRDQHLPCISCQKAKIEHAGHYYSGGHYPILRYNEDNVNGQCLRCNFYLSGNLGEYYKNLKAKIGDERLQKLDELAAHSKRHGYKWNRFELIEIIEKY